MEKKSKLDGYCLITASLLMILTMVLHPSGGNIEVIIKVAKIAMISHTIAVFSVPIVAFGFYGLAKRLQTESRFSYLGFTFIIFGLIAIMFAGLLNGLVLPIYALRNQNANQQGLETMKFIISYGFTFNNVLDYIFITFYSVAMLIWSIIITKTAIFPRWVGFYGYFLVILALIALLLEHNFVSVLGFAVYIFGIASWIILMGYFMVLLEGKNSFES
jgi:hypothetical protein